MSDPCIDSLSVQLNAVPRRFMTGYYKMRDWFNELTQPQATLATGFLTFLGAIVAVLLGWYLFRGKVMDMKGALKTTDDLLKAHKASVEETLTNISDKIGGLQAVTAKISADASDKDAIEEEADMPPDQNGEQPQPTFDTLEASWYRIRDRLEEVAAAAADGRTAAKYARIDRRNYTDLVSALNKDKALNGNGEKFLEAAEIWASHRSRRKALTAETVQRMQALATFLVPED